MTRKTNPKLNICLNQSTIEWACDKAKKAWPGVKLGLVGQHRETLDYYFQELGNDTPFVLNKLGKKVD